MAETRQAGYSRWFCRHCNRALSFDTHHQDTVSVNHGAKRLVFVHDHCGGTVRPSMPSKQMWTCPKCSSRWTRNKQRCDCGRKQPKRRPSHKDILETMPYERWVELYGETCNICGAGPGERRLHRDHDHKTGEPRGILCFPCNSMLRPRWTPEKLRAAADYLEQARV